MRLKRVSIFGFKTFADKAEFDVDGDLIAVVGPNGCGKSNLVDAILWGLGEGNARQLRAQTGVDVIFNGSSKRKPVGYAEVSLLFDNEDGSLPVPTPEVVVTRRLTRAGDSEYMINRQHCRLKDILDLLADSGLGRSGYSIVGQKEIDSALAASAEDRRAWIDEAAGVQRYRSRKIESLRRLAAAKDHLSRVTDILNELESQREPLRVEAELAARYKSVLGSLREVESGYLIAEFARAVFELEEIEKRIASSGDILAEECRRADAMDVEARKIAEQISRLESDIDALRQTQQSCLTVLERSDSDIRLGEERLRSLDELEKTLGEEAGQSKSRLEDAEREVASLADDLRREEAALELIADESVGAKETAQSLAAQLRDLDQRLDQARIANQQRLSAEAKEAQRLESLKQIERELKGIDRTLPELQSAIDAAQAEYDEKARIQSKVSAAIDGLEGTVREATKQLDSNSAASRDLVQNQAALEGRRRGIEATIEAHEGLAHGARSVLEAVNRGHLTDSYTPVGEAIRVERDHAVAIEIALGASVNDLIVAQQGAAQRAIDYLKRERGGRATFQPIPLMRPVHRTPELARVLDAPGIVGVGSELVTCSCEHRPVIESLLGRVVVVNDLETALKHAKTTGWSRMVTLDGEVVHQSGAVTGGHAAKPGYGIVQRKADLAEIESQLEELADKRAKFEEDQRLRVAEIETLRVEFDSQRQELRRTRDESETARIWLASLNDELRSTQRSTERLNNERERLLSEAVFLIDDIDVESIQAERDALLHESAARHADAELFESRLQEAELRRRQASERLSAAQKRLQAGHEAESRRFSKLETLEPDRARIAQQIQEASQLRQETITRKGVVDAEIVEATAKKQTMLEESFRLADEAKSARSNAQATADAVHQAELSRARADARRANNQQRLIEEYGISESEAVQLAPSIEIPEDAAALTTRLRREIKAMGDVNIGAIEAYERLTVRFDELNAQVIDIEGSIEEVNGAIKELDGLTRERFTSTFGRAQKSFAALFERLFAGGEASLRLATPENVLESGIEIDVTLPGKKSQRLELLSGGERSLCATAFLFALLHSKPSPLVVLDEVDAPLDGTNVDRFIRLLRDFASGEIWATMPRDEAVASEVGRTQFIVITHNPTTIESAPVWLGVTMQEPGVSQLVPMRTSAPSYAISMA